MTDDATRTLVEYRLEQARAALRDGQILIDEHGSVTGIINRSYYAMFYAGLALLQLIGKTPSKHAGVITWFDTEFVLPGVFPKEMSKAFHRLFELRQVSDYKISEILEPKKAEGAYHLAVSFVDKIQCYFQEKGFELKN